MMIARCIWLCSVLPVLSCYRSLLTFPPLINAPSALYLLSLMSNDDSGRAISGLALLITYYLMKTHSVSFPHIFEFSDTQDENEINEFQVKDHFSPTQKHERQLRMWRTCKSPGRKHTNALM